jgi:hypothetical protein
MNAKDKAFHGAEGASHVALAKHFSKLADSHNEAADSMDEGNPTAAAAHRSCAETCRAISAEHVESAQRHVDCCSKSLEDEIEKSELQKSIDLLNANFSKLVVPSGISAVPYDDNPMVNRIIPRTGQPQSDKERADAELHKRAVSPRLQEVLGTDADAQARG